METIHRVINDPLIHRLKKVAVRIARIEDAVKEIKEVCNEIYDSDCLEPVD